MISAWDIYWVMQLDSIGCTLGIIGFGLSVGGVICAITGKVNESCSQAYPELDMSKREAAAAVRHFSLSKKLLPAGLAVLVVGAFIPSTRTAAAMVVLPAIANNQTIQREAGDLYGIAKDALRNLAAPKQEARK